MLKTPSRKWKVTAAIILLIFVGLIVSVTAWNRAHVTLVSFSFDDASDSQYEYAFKISQKYGLTGSMFVATEMVNIGESGEGYPRTMSWDNVLEMSAAGWEIGSHSRTHRSLTDLSFEEIEFELRGSKAEIMQRTGIIPISFSSPFGDFDDETIAQIMTAYTNHVSWKGNEGRNPAGGFEHQYVGRLEVTADMPAELVCGEMVQAANNNKWLVLLFHGIVEGEAGEYEVTAETFEQIFACAKTLQDQGVIRVETIREAAALLDWRRQSRLARIPELLRGFNH